MTTANKQNRAPTPPRLSDNAIKSDPTQLLPNAGLIDHRHQAPQLHARIPIPKAPRHSHHHHHHHNNHHQHDYEDEEEEDAEIAAYSYAKATPHAVQNRPAINRGIAVNIAFRIAALDIDCEGYMYMLTQTGDHECGHPILPVRARGCEWRAFRDDMLTRFGWGSVLAANWLQSYNWACKVLNIEVDRILVGIDTHTPLVNAAKSTFGLDGTQNNYHAANHNHSCNNSSDPATSTRPSTSASQTSMSVPQGLSVQKVMITSTKSNVDHHAELGSVAGISNGVPSGSAGVEPTKSQTTKATSSTTTSESKTESKKILHIADNNNSSAKDILPSAKSERPKNKIVKKGEDPRRKNPIEDIYNTFRDRILYDCFLDFTPTVSAAAVTPTSPKTSVIPPLPSTTSTTTATRSGLPTSASSGHPPSTPIATTNTTTDHNKQNNISTPPLTSNSKKSPTPPTSLPPSPPPPSFHFHSASASTITITNTTTDLSTSSPPSSSSTTTKAEPTRKKKLRHRNKKKNRNLTAPNEDHVNSEEEEPS